MASSLLAPLKTGLILGYGLFTLVLYAVIAVYTGKFFTSTTEKETLELQLARIRLWDLSKNWTVFSHQIYTLQNGFRFHYVSNEGNATTSASKPLVIFIHGFPDSWGIWRHILSEESLQNAATLVAVDLPGYGGSESLERYTATAVLESLTEFIIAMRLKYGIDGPTTTHQQRTVIVGHDWGCLLAMRLAAEAPQLADRFIVTNGPLMPLAVSNINRRLLSSSKMLKSFLRSPVQERTLFFNAIRTLKPLLVQLWRSGYIFAFQLHPIVVAYLFNGGNQSLLKYMHEMSYGQQSYTITDAAECMASTLGPSNVEGKTQNPNGEGYAESVVTRPAISNFVEMCSYYRQGTALEPWTKSIETITSLHSIAQETGIQRTASGAGIFDELPGTLKANTTIIWGQKDHALTRELCLDGISDYLTRDSQVVELPISAHWTPLERDGRIALGKAVEWAVDGEREDIEKAIALGTCYPSAMVTVRKLSLLYSSSGMVTQEGPVYCTLLLSDNYLPGAVVLAHSLRDNGTEAKLVALYTPDTLQAATINELQTVYDELIPVYRMTNHTPANLWLMERPDLIATFTKIELWRQTQYKRIVYIDSDVVAIRAPDELLAMDVDFAAAPDVGWPDCFNSGVMVLRPNMQDYYALKALAERGTSFDGADQGLLNLHFRDWHRLSFTYNCTPSANYQYAPAYKHFQSTISLIHFIGSQKPWNMSRQVAPLDSPYNQLLGRWWTIYDRHYRSAAFETPEPSSRPAAPQVHYTDEPVSETHAQHFPDTVTHRDFEQQTHSIPVSEHTPHQQLLQHEATSHPQPVYHPPEGGSYKPVQVSFYSESGHAPLPMDQSTHNIYAEQPSHHEYTGHPPQHIPTEHPSQHIHEEHPPQHIHEEHPPQHIHEEHPPQHIQAEHHAQHTQEKYSTQHIQAENHAQNRFHRPVISVVPQYVRGEEHITAYIQPQHHHEHTHHFVQPRLIHEPSAPTEHTHKFEQYDTSTPQPQAPIETQRAPSPQPPPQDEPIFEAPRAEWDASREPPPLHSKPEGIALESKTYTMSVDHQLFQPPESYPEAPKDMWYQVPETKPEPQKLTQLFPWETNAPKPTRVFADDERQSQPLVSPTSTKGESWTSQSSQPTSWTSEVTSVPSESWDTYSRSNAWDEVPEIQKYIQSIQQARKARAQVISGGPSQQKATSPLTPTQQHQSRTSSQDLNLSLGTRITDFPSPQERPSLPVTPAPIHRGPALGSPEEYTTAQLPAATGVPNQEDWNPSLRLEELRQRQNSVLDDPDSLVERLTKVLGDGYVHENKYENEHDRNGKGDGFGTGIASD
ncbi:glycogenin [Aspergillus mulundensis]|uniref:glycogenin glucosyltransferase n=1 Tax=Aspergillus mulundensis TaxID=1810919 RepID=A0A3D8T4V9_9EURO|nr:hypothetical protein DSM5745_00908 [Aspergillus mulundensis]RDW93586.1 hypothetical protein DSM5745_00908 [Aspergillus mulundensis]